MVDTNKNKTTAGFFEIVSQKNVTAVQRWSVGSNILGDLITFGVTSYHLRRGESASVKSPWHFSEAKFRKCTRYDCA